MLKLENVKIREDILRDNIINYIKIKRVYYTLLNIGLHIN